MAGITVGHYDIEDSAERILEQLETVVAQTDFTQDIDVTEILDLCRTARHPAYLWSVDFVEPRNDMSRVRELIQIIIEGIYKDQFSIERKPGIKADLYQEAAFQNIRCHILSEIGKANDSLGIYNQFYDAHYDKLNTARQGNLLFAAATANLCCRKFTESYKFYNELWILTKYSSPAERFDNGVIDNLSFLSMVYNFFIKHVQDFRDFLQSELKSNKPLWDHKKISFLHILHDDHTWLVSLVGRGFYDHASQLMSDLPTFTGSKNYIPRNERHFHTNHRIRPESPYEGWQQVYAEKWDYQEDCASNKSGYYNKFKCENYKYSFLHFDNDHAKDGMQHNLLLTRLTEHLDTTKWQTLVYGGCALAPVYNKLTALKKDVTCVDISEQVCFELKKDGVACNHYPIQKYVEENKGDMLFLPDILSHLQRVEVEELIQDAAENYTFMTCLIETKEDIRRFEIQQEYQHYRPIINLHQTEEPQNWYRCLFLQHWEIVDDWNDDGTIIITVKNKSQL